MTLLVDYSSDSDPEPEPPTKKRKPEARPNAAAPPLPASFHDLYASTVRHSTADDPSLHQGRIRQIPHVAGNWPSHLYVEWHPDAAQHSLLAKLLADLQRRVGDAAGISTFLTSDLGAPQPLHISLSRPFVLSTAEKDAFLARIAAQVKACNVRPFDLRCSGLEWHRTAESNRSFLVLRVRDVACDGAGDVPIAGGAPKRSSATAGDGDHPEQATCANLQLAELLRRCNAAVRAFNQPELYQRAGGSQASEASIGEAFHVSIAWSFAAPDDELRGHTEKLSKDPDYAAAVTTMDIPVDGIKAKIGNVVTHIPLPQRGSGDKSRMAGGIFGM